MEKNIKHKGIVKEVKPSSLVVSIVTHSACAACHAKGACTIADIEEKEIEVVRGDRHFSPGQELTVILTESQGFQALNYGYVLPFLIVLLTLIFVFALTDNEVAAGLLSLAVLIPYYTTLYFFRHNLKKVFKFEVEEIK